MQVPGIATVGTVGGIACRMAPVLPRLMQVGEAFAETYCGAKKDGRHELLHGSRPSRIPQAGALWPYRHDSRPSSRTGQTRTTSPQYASVARACPQTAEGDSVARLPASLAPLPRAQRRKLTRGRPLKGVPRATHPPASLQALSHQPVRETATPPGSTPAGHSYGLRPDAGRLLTPRRDRLPLDDRPLPGQRL